MSKFYHREEQTFFIWGIGVARKYGNCRNENEKDNPSWTVIYLAVTAQV